MSSKRRSLFSSFIFGGKSKQHMVERHRIEEELLRTQNLLFNIGDNSQAVIYAKDLEGRYILVNKQFEQIFGLNNEKIIGHDDFDIYPKDIAEELRANDKAVSDAGETLSREETILQLDGWHTYISIKFPLRDVEGNTFAIAGISTDITERKQQEEEIRRQSARIQTLAELSQILSGNTMDYQRVLQTVVHRCAELIGDGASIFLRDPESPYLELSAVYNTEPEAIEIFTKHMRANPVRADEAAYGYVIKTGQPVLFPTVDMEKLKSDPNTTPERRDYYEKLPIYSAMFAPLRAEDQILGVLGLGRHHPDRPKYTADDLTFLQDIADRSALVILNARLYNALQKELEERKHAEEEIRRLNSDLEQRVAERTTELEKANKELEAFAYSVSHDLRAPLRAMVSFSRILQIDFSPSLPPEGQEFLERIITSGDKMNKLIEDILSFSRISRQSVNKEKVNMYEMVREITHMLDAEVKERLIELEIAPLPASYADPNLIQQVWVNLLSNAFKYTRKKEKTCIEVGFETGEEETTYFVRDNGAGFDMKYTDQLFVVFQRLHSEAEFEGTGIGLANVKRIIERHDGKIWANAEPEQGATFYFTLPHEPKFPDT